MKIKLSIITLLIGLLLMSCTSHPVIFPEPLKPGESYIGGVWAAENVLPQFVYRRGVTESFDIGLRIGIPPVHGTGVDGTLKLIEIGNHIHSLNASFTYADQSNFSISYINAKKRIKNNATRYKYFGLRYVYIPFGYWGSSSRFGAFWGRNYNKNWGFELGYFHDFASETRSNTEGYAVPISFEPYTGVSIKLFSGHFFKN